MIFPQTGHRDLLQDADRAFREGRYVEAAVQYQEAAERGAVNSSIYYNQGNAWFMAGEVHKAHLSYLKAEALSPGDGDIKRNLSFIRAQSGEEGESSSEGELLRVLFFWHYDLSLRLRSLLFVCFSGVFWILLLLLFFFRRKGRFFPFWPVITAALFTSALFLSILAGRYSSIHHPGGVTLSETTARKGDGDSFEAAFNRPLSGGTEFRLKEDRSGWYRIELPDGSEGWIKSEDAGLVSYP